VSSRQSTGAGGSLPLGTQTTPVCEVGVSSHVPADDCWPLTQADLTVRLYAAGIGILADRVQDTFSVLHTRFFMGARRAASGGR